MKSRIVLACSLALLATVATTGCARRLVGSPINEDDIPKLAAGKTTKTEVLKLFGAPYSIEARGDQEVLTYVHGTEFAWTVVVYSENRRAVDMLTIFVDRNGIVSNYAFSKGVSAPDLYRGPGLGPPR